MPGREERETEMISETPIMGRAQEKAKEMKGEGREQKKKDEMSEEALGVGREVTLTRDVGLSRMRAIMLKSKNGKTQR